MSLSNILTKCVWLQVPYELYADAVSLATAAPDAQADLASDLLLKMPASNFRAFQLLVQHLRCVACGVRALCERHDTHTSIRLQFNLSLSLSLSFFLFLF